MDFLKTYDYRMFPFFKDESKGEHIARMRKSLKYGREEKISRLTVLLAEHLVMKDATRFAKLLNILRMRFQQYRGFGKDSFRIESLD